MITISDLEYLKDIENPHLIIGGAMKGSAGETPVPGTIWMPLPPPCNPFQPYPPLA